MIDREELLKSKEYWLEKFQNELYSEIKSYMNENKLNKTQFAKKIGVSKSYVSQVLNGSFDHKLSKLIELSLAINKIPLLRFRDIDTYVKLDKENKVNSVKGYDMQVVINYNYVLQDSSQKNFIYPKLKKTPLIEREFDFFFALENINKEQIIA